MTFKIIISFTFVVCLCLANALNLPKISNNLFITGRSPSPLPTPSPQVLECFNDIYSQAIECRNTAIKNWNITDKSPVKDLCCAEWDLIDCDLGEAQAKCTAEDLDEVNKYIEELVQYYDSAQCQEYPKGSTHCILPVLSKLSDSRPPLPSPLAIDCLGTLPRDVRLGCYITAERKWNVTRRAPIRNICCAAWDDIDCLDEIIKVRCPASEQSDTEDYFKKVEDWATSEACSVAPYHSANCSNSPIPESKPQFRPYVPNTESRPELRPYIPIPMPLDNDNSNRVNKDYVYFMLNYMMTAFPHLLHLMILLAIILVIIIVIQCHLLMRQMRQDRLLAGIAPPTQGYHKLIAN